MTMQGRTWKHPLSLSLSSPIFRIKCQTEEGTRTYTHAREY